MRTLAEGGHHIPSFVVLGNYTEQGIKNFKDVPARIASAKEQFAAAGGRQIFFYLTMGPHDFVSVIQVPDDETAARLMIAIAAAGNIRTTTMRAFTEDETARLAESIAAAS